MTFIIGRAASRRLGQLQRQRNELALPQTVPGLVLWLDASQITGLSDTDAVSSWPAVVGEDDFTEATNRPTYRTNIANGLPAVRFDGGDYLNGNTRIDPQGVTYFWVIRADDTGITQFFIGNGSLSGGLVLRVNADTFQADREGSTTFATSSTTLVDNTLYQGDFSYRISDGAYQWGLNGADDGSGSSIQSFNQSTLCLGGRDGGTANRFTGDIHEVLLYYNVLDGYERQLIRDYLTVKWGV